MPAYTIDRRQLVAEVTASDPILKRVAEQVMREAFFEPAVKEMQTEFEEHDVTQEIRGGVEASNISSTLRDASFDHKGNKDDDSPPNLTSFIGFDESPEEVLKPIVDRLDPSHQDGPKMTYAGREPNKLVYRFSIQAPDEEAIYNATPFPTNWAEGDASWAKRMEMGIPGIGHFLNVRGRPSSRSGGGIQIEGQLRTGRFKPVSYLSQLFNNFLRRVVGRVDSGRPL